MWLWNGLKKIVWDSGESGENDGNRQDEATAAAAAAPSVSAAEKVSVPLHIALLKSSSSHALLCFVTTIIYCFPI